jgi:hypothetical protein
MTAERTLSREILLRRVWVAPPVLILPSLALMIYVSRVDRLPSATWPLFAVAAIIAVPIGVISAIRPRRYRGGLTLTAAAGLGLGVSAFAGQQFSEAAAAFTAAGALICVVIGFATAGAVELCRRRPAAVSRRDGAVP